MSTANLSSSVSSASAALSTSTSTFTAAAVFRVDKFVVPTTSLDAFLTRLRYVHAALVDVPGSVQRHILSQIGGDGEFNVVTFLEWADREAMTAVVAQVQKRFAEDGFDPKKMVADLGIRADQGFYQKA